MKVVYIIERVAHYADGSQHTSYYKKTTPFAAEYTGKKHEAAMYVTKAAATAAIKTLDRKSKSVQLTAITYVSELPEVIQTVTLKEVKALYAELGMEFEPSGDSYYAAEQYDVFEFATAAERDAFIRERREQCPADTNGYPY